MCCLICHGPRLAGLTRHRPAEAGTSRGRSARLMVGSGTAGGKRLASRTTLCTPTSARIPHSCSLSFSLPWSSGEPQDELGHPLSKKTAAWRTRVCHVRSATPWQWPRCPEPCYPRPAPWLWLSTLSSGHAWLSCLHCPSLLHQGPQPSRTLNSCEQNPSIAL